MEIYTYGGLEILQGIFNAIAMVFAKGGIVKTLLFLCALFSGFWAIGKSLFSSSIQPLIFKFFLPVLVIVGLLMVPKTDVRIIDNINSQKVKKVSNVPFLLATIAHISSKVGYNLTQAIESVMHIPNDEGYNKSGMIFGADAALDIKKYKIRNGDLERNLMNFSKQCIFTDMSVGRYGLDEVKKSTDIWQFLADNTSSMHQITYVTPGEKPVYKTCKEAAKEMESIFSKEKAYYAKQDVSKNLPAAFQALTGLKNLQQNSQDMVGQQLMMNFLAQGFDNQGFATVRAKEQQRTTYRTLGELASTSLVTMRAVFEALLYASFIFVVPMSVLMGFSCIYNWAFMLIWIQLWPPFYVILNYIMKLTTVARADAILHGLTSDEKGLSFFTSSGLFELNQDIYALSGYLAASIPFISYAVLKGGVSSFMHLSSAMMTPAHQAASTAAAEQSSGNYSFANTSFGQQSFLNRTAFQNNLAPTLSSGYSTVNDGYSQTVRTEDGKVMFTENRSNLMKNLFSDENLSKNLNSMHQTAQSHVETSQQNLQESVSNHTRSFSDVTDFLSSAQNVSESTSGKEGISAQQSANTLISESQNFAKNHGISERTSMDLLLSTSAPKLLKVAGVSGTISDGNVNEETWQEAKNLSQSETFQQNLQNVQDFATSGSIGEMSDQGKRLTEGFTQSLDSVKSAQEQHQHSLSNMEQISQSETVVRSMSIQQRESLDQKFVDWGSKHFEGQGGHEKFRSILKGPQGEQDDLAQQFLFERSQDIHRAEKNLQEKSLEGKYTDSGKDYLRSEEEWSGFKPEQISQQQRDQLSSKFSEQKKGFFDKYQALSDKEREISWANHSLAKKYSETEATFQEKESDYANYKRLKNARNYVTGTVNQGFSWASDKVIQAVGFFDKDK